MKTLITATIISAILISTAGANVAGTNKLGLKLGLETSKELKGKNFMVSPVSLHQALSIAANGTDLDTRREVEEILGSSVEENNLLSLQFVKSLGKKNQNKFVQMVKPNLVSIQNSIWRTNGATDGRLFIFAPEFKTAAKAYYNAESFELDFKNADSAKVINKWAEDKTKGLVKEIIDADTLDPMLWVIMNATYMEASWAKPFHEMKSNAPKFTLLNKDKVETKMISGRQYVSYSRLQDGSEVAAIPFSYLRGAPELEFVIYLPKENKGFASAQKEFFAPSFFEAVKRDSTLLEAFVTLPKFSFDTSVEMKKNAPLTKAMNLNFLFQNSADFSMLASPESLPSIVGLIKQNGRIELDEKGVKAAVVTIIGGIERTSVPVDPTVNMIVDRPFMFAIVEKSSNAILFSGSVVDPR
jgi:serpin B